MSPPHDSVCRCPVKRHTSMRKEAAAMPATHRLCGLRRERGGAWLERPFGRAGQGVNVKGACAMPPIIIPVPGSMKAASHR